MLMLTSLNNEVYQEITDYLIPEELGQLMSVSLGALQIAYIGFFNNIHHQNASFMIHHLDGLFNHLFFQLYHAYRWSDVKCALNSAQHLDFFISQIKAISFKHIPYSLRMRLKVLELGFYHLRFSSTNNVVLNSLFNIAHFNNNDAMYSSSSPIDGYPALATIEAGKLNPDNWVDYLINLPGEQGLTIASNFLYKLGKNKTLHLLFGYSIHENHFTTLLMHVLKPNSIESLLSISAFFADLIIIRPELFTTQVALALIICTPDLSKEPKTFCKYELEKIKKPFQRLFNRLELYACKEFAIASVSQILHNSGRRDTLNGIIALEVLHSLIKQRVALFSIESINKYLDDQKIWLSSIHLFHSFDESAYSYGSELIGLLVAHSLIEKQAISTKQTWWDRINLFKPNKNTALMDRVLEWILQPSYQYDETVMRKWQAILKYVSHILQPKHWDRMVPVFISALKNNNYAIRVIAYHNLQQMIQSFSQKKAKEFINKIISGATTVPDNMLEYQLNTIFACCFDIDEQSKITLFNQLNAHIYLTIFAWDCLILLNSRYPGVYSEVNVELLIKTHIENDDLGHILFSLIKDKSFQLIRLSFFYELSHEEETCHIPKEMFLMLAEYHALLILPQDITYLIQNTLNRQYRNLMNFMLELIIPYYANLFEQSHVNLLFELYLKTNEITFITWGGHRVILLLLSLRSDLFSSTSLVHCIEPIKRCSYEFLLKFAQYIPDCFSEAHLKMVLTNVPKKGNDRFLLFIVQLLINKPCLFTSKDLKLILSLELRNIQAYPSDENPIRMALEYHRIFFSQSLSQEDFDDIYETRDFTSVSQKDTLAVSKNSNTMFYEKNFAFKKVVHYENHMLRL